MINGWKYHEPMSYIVFSEEEIERGFLDLAKLIHAKNLKREAEEFTELLDYFLEEREG